MTDDDQPMFPLPKMDRELRHGLEPEAAKEFVTKRTFLAGAVVLGLLLAAVIASVIIVALAINGVQQDEIAHNKDRLAHEAAVNRRQAKLIRDLHEITHPTPAQADHQLREGIKRCLSRPLCRRLFPKLDANAAGLTKKRPHTSSKPTVGSGPGATSTPLRRPQSAGPSPSSPTRPARPQRRAPAKRQPSAPSSGGSPNPPPSPPPPSKPTINIQAPLPVQVCADKLLGLNC